MKNQLVCSLSYPECKAHVPIYVSICVLSGCTIFFHAISLLARFFGNVIENKICFDFLYEYFMKQFSFYVQEEVSDTFS